MWVVWAKASFRSGDANQTCGLPIGRAHYPEHNPMRFLLFLLHRVITSDVAILCSFAENTKGWSLDGRKREEDGHVCYVPICHQAPLREKKSMANSRSPQTVRKDSNVCHVADSLCSCAPPLSFTDLLPCSNGSTATAQLLHPINPMGLLLFERHAKYLFSLEPLEIRIKWPRLGT